MWFLYDDTTRWFQLDLRRPYSVGERRADNGGGTFNIASLELPSFPFNVIQTFVIQDKRIIDDVSASLDLAPMMRASLFRPRAPVSPQSPPHEHVANGDETTVEPMDVEEMIGMIFVHGQTVVKGPNGNIRV
jgi:hypothetical protein